MAWLLQASGDRGVRIPRKPRSSYPGLGGPGQSFHVFPEASPVCTERESTNGIGWAHVPSLESEVASPAPSGSQLIQHPSSVVWVSIGLETQLS